MYTTIHIMNTTLRTVYTTFRLPTLHFTFCTLLTPLAPQAWLNLITSYQIFYTFLSQSPYVCTAMRFVVLTGIELKLSVGVGDGPTRFMGIFSKRPHLGHRSSMGQSIFKMTYGYKIWWEEPLTRAWCIAGVKSHAGVIWGQLGVKLLRNAWPN